MTLPDVQTALVDGQNMAVLGATQTGKTSFVRELQAKTPRRAIWVNERGSKRVPGVAGVEACSLRAVKTALANGEQRVEFLPEDRRVALPELRRFLWELADRVDREAELQVVVDEVDRVAEQSGKKYGNLPSRDAVRDFTSEGVKRGVKFVGITQDPTTYDKQALRNSRYRAIWPMSAEHQNAVRKYGFDWDRVRDAEQYAGVLHYMDGTVIGEAKAEARYA